VWASKTAKHQLEIRLRARDFLENMLVSRKNNVLFHFALVEKLEEEMEIDGKQGGDLEN
jgi:hypothetical protein